MKSHPEFGGTDFFLAKIFQNLTLSGSRSRGLEIDDRSVVGAKIVASIEVSCLLVAIMIPYDFPVCIVISQMRCRKVPYVLLQYHHRQARFRHANLGLQSDHP